MLRRIFQIGLFITISGVIHAQQKILVKGTSFKSNLEVAEAQISAETIMLRLHEIDKSNPKYQTDNCDSCKDGKDLNLDIDFKRGFKFPIEEKDSVFVRFTYLQESLAEYRFTTGELEEQELLRNKTEEEELKNSAAILKQKSEAISKRLQAGEITPQEAAEQIMMLSQPQMDAIMNSQTMKKIENIDEYNDSKPMYSINFYNDENLTTSDTFSGYLYIKTFNTNRFVAEYCGEMIEECVEKRAATSMEEEERCSAYPSKHFKGKGVLNESTGSILIDVNILEFLDNR